MLDLALAAGLLALQFFSLGCLALAQDKHWRNVMGAARLHLKGRLRLLGGVGLPLGLILAWSVRGWSFGNLIWLLSLPLAGYAVALVLAWRAGLQAD